MTDPDYADMALKFIEHFLWIASSMAHLGGDTGMWDEEDGFFYDVLRLPDGQAQRLKVRSMVGLLPLCAATTFEGELIDEVPGTRGAASSGSSRPVPNCRRDPRPDEARRRRPPARLHPRRDQAPPRAGQDARRERVPQPVRHPLAVALSTPTIRTSFHAGGQEYRVAYLPAESDTGMFGGNSNWRGPIWMPVNALIIRALLQYYTYYGNDFTVECPTGSGRHMNLYQVAEEISRRLANIFLKDKDGRRPVYGGTRKFQEDPHWRDCLLFYEYFHGDNGAGLGASHQTGWTGIIARAMHLFATMKPEAILEGGKKAYFEEQAKPASAVPAGTP